MKSKPTRKNRFRKNRQARRALVRDRIVYTSRVVMGALALMAASGAFIFAHDYFTQAGHFQVRQIEVTGMQRLSRHQVLESAGIAPQSNILSVNLATTRKRLLAQPWVAEATVSRQIPSGLHLHINEQRPLALLDMGHDQGFLINVAGEVFKRQAPSDNEKLPLIQGLSHADLPVDGKPTTKAFEAVMALMSLLDEDGSPLPLAGIRRIRMDREIGATLYAGQGQRAIKLGFGRYRQKCEALKRLMARLRRNSRLKNYRVIDLYDVNRIVITLASAGPSDADKKEV